MKNRIFIGLLVLVVALISLWALDYLAVFNFASKSSPNSDANTQQAKYQNKESTSNSAVDLKVEAVAQHLEIPWAIVFTSPNRILVTERTGKIRQIVNGQLNENPVYTFQETAKGGEIGLMGMVADPSFKENNLIYVCVGYQENGEYYDKVVTLIDESEQLSLQRTIIDNIPANRNHAGCELAFGPDQKLYVTTGDAQEKSLAQDRDSLAGKILRLNTDGSIPSDNPFPGSPIYSYGHRNPQGIAWRGNGALFAVEHGPSGNDGPGGGDELNVISRGNNYGWPLVSHEKTMEGTTAPLLTFTPAVAPASLIAYEGDQYPQFKNSLLFGLLRGSGIMQIRFESDSSNSISFFKKLETVNVGRIREITQGPDGLIYFSTSNTDGRGNPDQGDDKIYRLVPIQR